MIGNAQNLKRLFGIQLLFIKAICQMIPFCIDRKNFITFDIKSMFLINFLCENNKNALPACRDSRRGWLG